MSNQHVLTNDAVRGTRRWEMAKCFLTFQLLVLVEQPAVHPPSPRFPRVSPAFPPLFPRAAPGASPALPPRLPPLRRASPRFIPDMTRRFPVLFGSGPAGRLMKVFESLCYGSDEPECTRFSGPEMFLVKFSLVVYLLIFFLFGFWLIDWWLSRGEDGNCIFWSSPFPVLNWVELDSILLFFFVFFFFFKGKSRWELFQFLWRFDWFVVAFRFDLLDSWWGVEWGFWFVWTIGSISVSFQSDSAPFWAGLFRAWTEYVMKFRFD